MWSLAAALTCGCAAQATPPKSLQVTPLQVTSSKKDQVRVYLRSLDPWTQIAVAGTDLRVTADGAALQTSDKIVLLRKRGETTISLSGDAQDGAQGIRHLEVRAASPLRVGKETFAGRLEYKAGKLLNVLALEDYILGVLRGELPLPRIPVAAAAAQALAVRSYTLHYLEKRGPVFDVDDTTLFQRYVGLRYAPDDNSLRAGVQKTNGRYLVHAAKPLKAYYHSTCGDHTTDLPTGLARTAQEPLNGVPCGHCKASKYFRWESVIDEGPVLRAAGLTGRLVAFAVAERGPGDRARKLTVRSTDGERTVTANQFRLRAGPSLLRSTLIRTAKVEQHKLHVTGAGWGHGVGLCQMGAIGLANQGRTGLEIARYYYPHTTLASLR